MEKTAVLHYFPFDTVMKKICDILWPYLWKYGIFMTAVGMVSLLFTNFMITLQNQHPTRWLPTRQIGHLSTIQPIHE